MVGMLSRLIHICFRKVRPQYPPGKGLDYNYDFNKTKENLENTDHIFFIKV